ncbi:MAG TPA: tripartite tricarboxylate transporter substrate binding protein [Usitatibacter sp.]|nr:tripartite tricarboxylate transporter substrate binding protein [Usitatibacter sp.]
MKWIARLVLLAFALPGAASPAAFGAYPLKAVHLVVGFPPGSQPDIVARLLAHDLAKGLGQPVVVENMAGAAGNIAAERVAKSAPDGYTIGLLSQTHMVVNPSLYRLAYDPVKDLAPVTQVTVSPNLLVVSPAVPARSVAELVALAKAQPGALTFASSGSGSGTHMAAELFKSSTHIDIRHIPYKGVVAAIPDLLGNRVSLMFSPIPVALPLVREGKLRALAVTSLHRSAAAPDVPTVAEAGYPGFEATNWYGLVVPSRTPAAIIDTLHAEAVKALAGAELGAKLNDLGLEVIANTPEQFAAAIESEIPKWRKIIHDSALTPD